MARQTPSSLEIHRAIGLVLECPDLALGATAVGIGWHVANLAYEGKGLSCPPSVDCLNLRPLLALAVHPHSPCLGVVGDQRECALQHDHSLLVGSGIVPDIHQPIGF